MNWWSLKKIAVIFRRLPKAQFTKDEYDAFFNSPVWAGMVQVVATDISTCFDFIADPKTSHEELIRQRAMAFALQWFLMNRERLESRIVDVGEKNVSVNRILEQAVDLLHQIDNEENDK